MENIEEVLKRTFDKLGRVKNNELNLADVKQRAKKMNRGKRMKALFGSLGLVVVLVIGVFSFPISHSPNVVKKNVSFHTKGNLILPLAGTENISGGISTVNQGGYSSALSGNRNPGIINSSGNIYQGGISIEDTPSGTLTPIFSNPLTSSVRVFAFSYQNQALSQLKSACLPTNYVTLEFSDGRAVASFNEPFFGQYTTPLINLEIGEFGLSENSPASWVAAQVGSTAASVEFIYSDGASDVVVPTNGLAVDGRLGNAASSFGGNKPPRIVIKSGTGAVLANYTFGVMSSPTQVTPPNQSITPSNGPSNPSQATSDIENALKVALSCSEPPIERSLSVENGGSYESMTSISMLDFINGIIFNSVTFTSPTSAQVHFGAQPDFNMLNSNQAMKAPLIQLYSNTYVADAIEVNGEWKISLGSFVNAVTSIQQSGPRGLTSSTPIYTYSSSGLTAYAYLQNIPNVSNSVQNKACIPTGATYIEITTKGGIGNVSVPLFANYQSPLVSVTISTVDGPEGSPSTVVVVESSSSASKVLLKTPTNSYEVSPSNNLSVLVIPGEPSTVLGSSGSSISALDSSGNVTVTYSLSASTTIANPKPTNNYSLNPTMPAPGIQPANVAQATTEITQSFDAVFSCQTPFIERIQDIENGGGIVTPLESLYTSSLAAAYVENSGIVINQIVFVSPSDAFVNYNIVFRGTNQPPIGGFNNRVGEAKLINGTWEVSYQTACSAIALGGVSCTF